jgi:hypothetical protein
MAPLPPPCSGAIAPFYAAVIGCVGVLSGTLVVGAADRDANAGGRWWFSHAAPPAVADTG